MTTNLTHPAIQLRQMNPTARLTPTGNYAEIYVGTLTLTFSYETVIAVAIPGIGRIGTKQRWSTTTSKHQRAAGPYRFEVETDARNGRIVTHAKPGALRGFYRATDTSTSTSTSTINPNGDSK